MANQAFDTLARSVSVPSSRRGLLGGLTALALGLGGTILPDVTTARKKRKHKNRRKKKHTSTSTTCLPGTESCQGTCLNACPDGQLRNPITCGCCVMNTGTCSAAGDDGLLGFGTTAALGMGMGIGQPGEGLMASPYR